MGSLLQPAEFLQTLPSSLALIALIKTHLHFLFLNCFRVQQCRRLYELNATSEPCLRGSFLYSHILPAKSANFLNVKEIEETDCPVTWNFLSSSLHLICPRLPILPLSSQLKPREDNPVPAVDYVSCDNRLQAICLELMH